MWQAITSFVIYVAMLSLGLLVLVVTSHIFVIALALAIMVIGGVGLIGTVSSMVSPWLARPTILSGSGTVPDKSVTICDKSASRGPSIVGEKVRVRVYVAGPISKGNPTNNCHRAIQIGFQLMDLGYAPYVPHYSYFVDPDSTFGKGRYKQWISLDLSWISTCHALLRIPGPSAGADREVAWAKKIGVPVFETVETLLTEVPPTHAIH